MPSRSPSSAPDVSWDDVRERLHDRGLRWTPQRRQLVEVLAQTDGHITGAELVERCREQNPETTPSTEATTTTPWKVGTGTTTWSAGTVTTR